MNKKLRLVLGGLLYLEYFISKLFTWNNTL